MVHSRRGLYNFLIDESLAIEAAVNLRGAFVITFHQSKSDGALCVGPRLGPGRRISSRDSRLFVAG